MDFSDYWDVVWEIEMPSFDYLKDVYIISFSKCDTKTRIKEGYTLERQTNHLEQTLKLLKCEENANYLRDFCSRPPIWILRINS